MNSDQTPAPWQLAPVSLAARIATAALVTLSANAILAWPVTGNTLETLAFTIVPLLAAIRVARGFSRSLDTSAALFATAIVLSLGGLSRTIPLRPTLVAPLIAAIGVSVAGLLAVAAAKLRAPRSAVIELTRISPEGGPSRVRSH